MLRALILTCVGYTCCCHWWKNYSALSLVDVVYFVAEKDLVLEIDRLRHHAKNGTVQHGKRPKVQTGAVDMFISDLEDERDYWKRQVGELQQLLRSKSAITASRSPSRTAKRRSRSQSQSPTRPAATQTSRTTSPTRQRTISRATSPVVSLAKKVCQ